MRKYLTVENVKCEVLEDGCMAENGYVDEGYAVVVAPDGTLFIANRGVFTGDTPFVSLYMTPRAETVVRRLRRIAKEMN